MAKVNFLPEEQRLLIIPRDGSENRTSGGIIIPGGSDDKPEFGTIVRAGGGSEDRPMKYKVGDVIMYSQYAGVKVSFDLVNHGYKEYKVMNQADVMGKVEEVE